MKVFDTIISFLSSRVQNAGSAILVGSHERIPIRKESFSPITPSITSKKFVFIDGGNGEIASGPDMCVQFLRIYGTWYELNTRTKRELKERFVVVAAKQKDMDLQFEAKLFDTDGNELSTQAFDAFDPAIAQPGRRATPSSVASYVRKLLELGFAEQVMETLDEGDCIVRDGDLEPFGKAVEERINFLRLVADKKQVHVIGISKTSTLCTDAGVSAVSALASIAPNGSWLYHTGGKVGFVKLHQRSEYIFRCDILNQSQESLRAVIPALAANAEDPALLGYPYGLIEADKFARVPKEEAAQFRVRFSMQSKEQFKVGEKALDAHDILNMI